ncbi:MAG: lycopene cyclase family protein, partial [Bacteroidota bacterium]
MKYDYVIAGAGCAGLSLLYRILSQKDLSSKSILVIDKDDKDKNDRTWCFWEEREGVFEEVVTHQWPTLRFTNSEFTKECNLQRYRYKMIKGLDFYNHVKAFAKGFSNVKFSKEAIESIEMEG